MATQVSLNSGAVASAGALALQTNGTTEAVSISTGQVATLAQNPILTSGTANGVAYLNGSKVVTSGSALLFDGTNFSTTGTIKGSTTIGVGNATPSTSGSGITFPATQSASSDANTLDDYEEGTWTPVFASTGTNPTVTYSVQQGSYAKVGKFVYASFYLGTSAISGGTGRLLIGGLPFTNQNVNESDRSCLIFGLITGFSSTTTPTVGIMASNSTLIHLYTNNSADARDNKSTDVSCPLSSAPGLYGTIVYRAAA